MKLGRKCVARKRGTTERTTWRGPLFCQSYNIPRHSMYAIYAYIDPQNHPNVGMIWHTWSVWDIFSINLLRCIIVERVLSVDVRWSKREIFFRDYLHSVLALCNQFQFLRYAFLEKPPTNLSRCRGFPGAHVSQSTVSNRPVNRDGG